MNGRLQRDGWCQSPGWQLWESGILTGEVYPTDDPATPWVWHSLITGAGAPSSSIGRAMSALMLEHFQERQERMRQIIRHGQRRRHSHHRR